MGCLPGRGHDEGVSEIVVVTGAAGPLGRRVVDAVAADPAVTRVLAVDPALAPGSHPARSGQCEVRVVPFGLTDPRMCPALAGATQLVHLGPASGEPLDGTGGSVIDVAGFSSLLAVLADVAAVGRVVLLSTALVYGSRDDNPVPLTEDAPLRPDPAVPAAGAKATLEQLARSWARAEGATCAVLRPSLVVAPEESRWLSRSPWSTAGLQVRGAEAPRQFLHVDDLVSAVELLREQAADGVWNVAPDGWLPAEQLRALKGPAFRVRLGLRSARVLAGLGARLGLAATDPSALVAGTGPWVVANDRLRARGWVPTSTSDEAFVEVDTGGPWARLTPRHRQAIALGAVAAAVVGVVTAVGLTLMRLRRRSR